MTPDREAFEAFNTEATLFGLDDRRFVDGAFAFANTRFAQRVWLRAWEAAMQVSARPHAAQQPASFQARVDKWLHATFTDEICQDATERNHRFLEEAIELAQANGCTASEAHQLVDYVFGRPVGQPEQEVGGVMVCLAALCTARGINMDRAGETELARVWTKVEQIRAKQAAKPKHSPLPEHTPQQQARVAELEGALRKAREFFQDRLRWCYDSELGETIDCLAAIDAALSAQPAEG